MNAFLLTFGCVLVLSLSALFAAPLFVEWSEYRHVFEAQASRMVGRPVTIHGDIDVRVLPAPEIEFGKTVIGNSDPEAEAPLATVEVFSADLSAGALLQGALEATNVRLQSPVVSIRIDESGVSNLHRSGEQSLPRFVTGFALDEITFVDGRLSFRDAQSGADASLEDIDGVLTVQELEGPYRFSGDVTVNGERRELAFSTGKVDDARTPLKAVIEEPDGFIKYSFDGVVANWRSSPQLDGKFSIRAFSREKPDGESTVQPAPAPSFEAHTKLDASLEELRFTDLEVTLRRKNRSQTLKGSASVDLAGETAKVMGQLSAGFIDADVLLGSTEKNPVAPAQAIREFAAFLLANDDRVALDRLTISIEQLNLGADLLRNVNLTMATSGEAVEIAALSMAGPGGSALKASGELTGEPSAPVYTGKLDLQGAQVDPLLRWLVLDPEKAPQTEIGSFELAGNVQASPDKLHIESLTGTIDGAAFFGELHFTPGEGDERGDLALRLVSERLDLRQALADAVTLDDLLETPIEERKTAPGDDGPSSAIGVMDLLSGLDAEVEVAFGAVALPDVPEGPLEARFSYRDGTLEISRLSFNAGDAISVQGQGRIEQLTSAPNGRVDLALKAANAEAAGLLLGAIGLPNWITREERLEALSPLDLVVGLEARRDDDASDVQLSVAGSAGGTNVALNGDFQGRFDAFSKGTLDAEATLSNSDAGKIVRLLLPKAVEGQLEQIAAGEGVLRVTLQGSPGEGMQSLVSLSSSNLNGRFEGQSRWADGWLALDGEVSLSASDSTLALALLDLPRRVNASGKGFKVRSALTGESGRYRFSGLSGAVAGAIIDGNAELDLKAARPAVSIDATTSSASLPALLGLSVAWGRQPATADIVAQVIGASTTVWPSNAFALKEAAADIDLTLESRALTLFGDATAESAHLKLTLRPGVLQLSKLEGNIFEGKIAGSGVLRSNGTGASLEATLNLDGAELAPIGRTIAARVVAEGPVGVSVSVEGEGLSPAGLVASLAGKGHLSLGDGVLHNLDATPLKEVATADRAGDETAREGLTRNLVPRITSGVFDYEPVSVPFELRTGTIRITDAKLVSDEARANFRAYVELASLRLDSEWEVKLHSSDARFAAMPPVNLVVAGKLSEPGNLEATVTTAAVERYITMRRIEQDVEQLENLDVGGGTEGESEVTPPEMPAMSSDPAVAPEPLQQVEPRPLEAAQPSPLPELPPAAAPIEEARPPESQLRSVRVREEQPEVQEASETPSEPVLRNAIDIGTDQPSELNAAAPEAAPQVDLAPTEAIKPAEAPQIEAATAPAPDLRPSDEPIRNVRVREQDPAAAPAPRAAAQPSEIEAHAAPDLATGAEPAVVPAVPAPAATQADEQLPTPETGPEQLPWLAETEIAPDLAAPPSRAESAPARVSPPPRRRLLRRARPREESVDIFRRLGVGGY